MINIANKRTVVVAPQRVMLVSRDWEHRLQVQQMVKLGPEGAIADVVATYFVDYNKVYGFNYRKTIISIALQLI